MAKRLDVLVMETTGFSRNYSQEIIATGQVLVGGKPQTKPGAKVEQGETICVLAKPMAYVSRGGYKLEKALAYFDICLSSRICLDIGASTGGFTDCMLQHGAKKVFAVDVGSLQLAKSLQQDERVVSMEQQNICSALPEWFGGQVPFAAVDLSFVSLTVVLPSIAKLLLPFGELVCLIKPQFEVGKPNLNKKGIVKSVSLRKMAISSVLSAMEQNGLCALGLTQSPILGKDGNVEYLIFAKKQQGTNRISSQIIDECV